MSQGWICVHRKLLDNPIFKNDKLFRVFMYCLLKASHTKHDQLVGDTMISLDCGQLVTGRKAMSSDTGLSEQNVRTAMSKLEKLGILTSKPTNKFSVISITNWLSYQQTNQQVTSSQPTSNQQVTTNNNVNNYNNEDKETSASPKVEACPYQQILDVYHEVLPMVPSIQVLTDSRKTKIRNFWKKFGFNIEAWTNYLGFIKSNCTWMLEDRPNGKGGYWKAKNLEYFITEKCYLSVREDRASDQ